MNSAQRYQLQLSRIRAIVIDESMVQKLIKKVNYISVRIPYSRTTLLCCYYRELAGGKDIKDILKGRCDEHTY